METTPVQKISDLRHPQYTANFENWLKWRLTYLGGTLFLRKYLKKYGKREDNQDFSDRMSVSYVPAFAKAAINDVKNSIFERICDVSRVGGPSSYQTAVSGNDGGVDLKGSSMNSFIGRELLPELLTMSRVGVFVDMPPLPGETKADKHGKRPYLYWYKTEDILCWADRCDQTREFKAVLLLDTVNAYNDQFNLPTGIVQRYRFVYIGDDGFVHVQFYNAEGQCCDEDCKVVNEDTEIILTIRKIPFVLFQLSDSLLSDVADYQISLMNLASSDMGYALKSNFPFYTEQVDWRSSSPYLKTAPPGQTQTNQTALGANNVAIASQEQVREVRVGVAAGRQYGIGAERPGFIHPSSEPLRVSMEKQEQLKGEIRTLISLSLSTLTPSSSSAESKQQDNKGLEAGLSCIGFELEHGERKIAELWSMYEGDSSIATIGYPENYQLLSEEDRRDQTDHLVTLLPTVNSLTYQKEIAKRIADISLGNKVSTQVLKKIKTEIDSAQVIVSDPDVIKSDLEAGLVSVELASKTRGYPAGEVEKAKEDHADRLKRIADAQAPEMGAARGVKDLGANPNAGKDEKKESRDTTQDPVATDKTRGEAK